MDVTELAMLLESMDLAPVTPAEFMQAAEKAKKFKLEDDQKLQMYGMFKQSTVGDVNIPEPSALDFIEKAKWDAWKSYSGFPRTSAAMAYVYIVQQMEETAKEMVDGKAPSRGHFISAVSTLMPASESEDKWTEHLAIFQHVVENNVPEVAKLLAEGVNVNTKNEEGMTALHFAADRGFKEIVELLLSHGADKEIVDADEQTALDYATVCEHDDIIALLSGATAAATAGATAGADVVA